MLNLGVGHKCREESETKRHTGGEAWTQMTSSQTCYRSESIKDDPTKTALVRCFQWPVRIWAGGD